MPSLKSNRTTFRTIEILKFLSHCTSADLEQLCTALSLPKTSCYDILETLVETGMIQIVYGEKKKYALALGAYQLGMGYRRNFDTLKAFDEPLQTLANQLNKTCFFGLPENAHVVYLIKKEPLNPILTLSKIGSINPMYCTALGKAMLAFMPKEKQLSILDATTFEARTTFTHTNPENLMKEFESIRTQGYALDWRELENHSLCVGAPVFNEDGTILGAISVSDLYSSTEDYHAVGRIVRNLAHQLSLLCGYRPTSHVYES